MTVLLMAVAEKFTILASASPDDREAANPTPAIKRLITQSRYRLRS